MTKAEAIKYLQQLYPYGGHCWLDEQRIEAISMAVKALQEEPISEDLEQAAKTYAKKESHGYEPCNIVETFKAGANWQKQLDMKRGYITALQGEKQFARYILEMIANGWHNEAIKTACNDKIKEDEQ